MSPHRRYRHGDPRRTTTRVRVWWQREVILPWTC